MKHFLLGLILSLVLGACSPKPLPNLDVAMSTLDTKRYNVILDRCTDGDTARFWISGRSVAVRFLSIDTPELAKDGFPAQPFAQEAAALTCSHLQGATQIVLELDPIAGIEDQYGRWLAYVWVDDVLLQEILIEAGFADLRYAHNLLLYDAELQRILDITQQRRIGRWK